MASERSTGAAAARRPVLAPLVAAALALAAALPAQAGNESGPGIYTCIDAQGRRLTSDRPIPECNDREQRQLNRDGSLRRIVPPTLTPEQRAQREADERRQALQRAAQSDAVRRDRNLVNRFPDEAAHGKAREAALESVRLAIALGEKRAAELQSERRTLLDEAEFYKGRQMPARLKSQLDANQAASEAQKAAAAQQQAEVGRINALYDAELARLRRLWAGAAPGSLGPQAAGGLSPAAAPAAPSAVR